MTIDPKTHTGAVALVVPNLERSLDYYQHNIGLHLLDRSDGIAQLGADARPLLWLYEQKGARPVERNRAGLYHFAILLPTRVELARTLRHFVDTRTPLSGMSDHGVSEALYLNDPDGHGIEIYRDRPRAEWTRIGDAINMTLDPLDVEDLLREVTVGRIRWDGIAEGTVIGHTHLHVSRLGDAERFYIDTLGFDLIQRYGGQATFVSAGGYHHHLGLNTWAGVGAPPPSEDAARLLWFELLLPTVEALRAVTARLDAAGHPYIEQNNMVILRDSSAHELHLVVEA